jgi:hypothetical protein
VQNDSTEQLHVEVHHVPDHGLIAYGEAVLSFFQAARRVFHDCECFGQNLIQFFPLILWLVNFGKLFLPGRGLGTQRIIGQALELFVQFVHPTHERRQPP